MAQKSKAPAAKQSGKAGKTVVKAKATVQPAKAAKSAVKTAAAKPSPVKKVAAVKSTPPVKPAKAKAASVPTKAAPVPAKAKEKAAPEIAQAKAALKKQSVAAAPVPAISPVPASAVKEVKVRARKIAIDINPNEAASALAQKWMTLYKKAEQIEAKPYSMKSIFQEKTAIVHKVLGWGYILANRNDRLEVLFKDGIKYLISNYKP